MACAARRSVSNAFSRSPSRARCSTPASIRHQESTAGEVRVRRGWSALPKLMIMRGKPVVRPVPYHRFPMHDHACPGRRLD
jgi:hypothetical protein